MTRAIRRWPRRERGIFSAGYWAVCWGKGWSGSRPRRWRFGCTDGRGTWRGRRMGDAVRWGGKLSIAWPGRSRSTRHNPARLTKGKMLGCEKIASSVSAPDERAYAFCHIQQRHFEEIVMWKRQNLIEALEGRRLLSGTQFPVTFGLAGADASTSVAA